MKSKVLRATQSPLNKMQWHCDLECGCSTWITSKRKPTRAECYADHPQTPADKVVNEQIEAMAKKFVQAREHKNDPDPFAAQDPKQLVRPNMKMETIIEDCLKSGNTKGPGQAWEVLDWNSAKTIVYSAILKALRNV